METLDRPSTNGHAAGRIEAFRLVPARRNLPWRRIVAALIALALVVAGALIFVRVRGAANVAYTTAPVTQGNLVQTVSATGTVNPQNTIAVGTQVSGTIGEIDVDFNSKVKKGQVLARLDPTALTAQLNSAKAQLAQSQAQALAAQSAATGSGAGIGTAALTAQAAVATAQAAQATSVLNQQAIAGADANVTKAQSALTLAQQTAARDKTLLAQGYIAQSQADTDQSALVSAQTSLQSAQVAAQQARSQAAASQAQAQASVAQSASQGDAVDAARAAAAGSAASAAAAKSAIAIQEANVEQAETNLNNTVITSPVDGTVIARDVSVGTTVAASLQTPTLFSIAQDLSKMEVDLAVGEPDIGSVKPGEAVDFSVLAFPNRTFHGVVSQVRKSPVTTNNVVTYTTVVLVDNADQALLPGMTANATIDVQTAANALVVPVAALTYAPKGAGAGTHHHAAAAGASAAPAGPAASGTTGAANASGASPWGATTGSAGTTVAAGSTGRVFVQRDGKLTRVPVTVTLVSGTQAAVTPATGATLAAGDAVVVGDDAAATTRTSHAPAAQNPLTGGTNAAGALRGIH
jgi:HlyD family secretion protein